MTLSKQLLSGAFGHQKPGGKSVLLLLPLLSLLLLPGNIHAQRTLGVIWDPPADHAIAGEQLNRFAELGISHLITGAVPLSPLVEQIDSLEFTVFGQLPVKYPVVRTFEEPDSILISMINSSVNGYARQKRVKTLGLFKYGQIEKRAFARAIHPFVREIRHSGDWELFYITGRTDSSPIDSLFDFKLLAVEKPGPATRSGSSGTSLRTGGYLYTPPEAYRQKLKPVKTFLERAYADSIPAFFNAFWLLNTTEKYPELKTTLVDYAEGSSFVFPLPREYSPADSNPDIAVILLLILWATFILNYSFSPLYKKALTRYFVSHRFFVDDVMMRHIRSPVSSIIVLAQHALTGGIAAYCLAYDLFAKEGLNVISHHYPGFISGGDLLLPFLLWGCLLTLSLTIISILWIKLTNKKAKYFSQVILLYSWPFHINFLIITVMVPLLVAGTASTLLYIMGGIFLFILFSSFIITAFDASAYLQKRRGLFLVGSIGLYLLLFIALAAWIFSHSYMLEVLQLASNLTS